MKLTKIIKKAATSTLISFYTKTSRNPNYKFIPDAYYISLGKTVISLMPYFGWKKAYRAAKRMDYRAFVIKGSTLNAELDKARMSGHKRAWGSYVS